MSLKFKGKGNPSQILQQTKQIKKEEVFEAYQQASQPVKMASKTEA